MLVTMRALLYHVLDSIRTRQSLQLEVLVLRHQLAVYQRSVARPRTRRGDRILWSFLSRHWDGWREGPGLRPPRDRDALAAPTIPGSLAKAQPTRHSRSARGPGRTPAPDPAHVDSQPALGRAAESGPNSACWGSRWLEPPWRSTWCATADHPLQVGSPSFEATWTRS